MIPGAAEAIAFGVTKQAVASLVKPVLEIGLAGFKSLSLTTVDLFGNRFSDYISGQAERHSCMSTIVFGHQKSLDDLYIPLTVVPSRELESYSEKHGILIDRFHTKLLPKEKRILITDTAGMGKSTLSKFLFLQCLKSGYAIPIFLELRHLSKGNSVFSILLTQLNASSVSSDVPKFQKRQVESLVKKGGLIFFFDGYDEIPFKDRETVTVDVKEFIEKYPNNWYLITSRPETGLLAFPTFKQFSIRPLKKEESFSLIRKYDHAGGRSEQLISKLQGRDFRAVQEFLKNPLLTSLLYRSFEYKQSVPIKKHIFYRQVFDALFDWHDASKDGYNTREKKSGLDIDAFHRMLRVIGFVSVMKGQVEGDTDAVLGWIRKARDICNLGALSESNFLDDLVRAVPIFVKDGDYYRWSHKSLAEYFAAQYICTEGKSQQAQVLTAFLNSKQLNRFSNVLDQVYDIDSAGFRTHLILPLARDFSTYWATSYKGFGTDVSAEEIRLRKSLSFDRTILILRAAPADFSEFEQKISVSLQEATGQSLASDSIGLAAMLFSIGKNDRRMMVVINGSFTTILEILESKKDPLIISRVKIDLTGLAGLAGGIKIKDREKPFIVGDDPTADYNSKENFDRLTKILAQYGSIINSDKMLAFEASFKDGARLEELADDLLQPIVSASRLK